MKQMLVVIAFFVVFLAGCDRDCDCCPESVPTAKAESHLEVRIFRLAYVFPDTLISSGQTLNDAMTRAKTPQGKIVFEKPSKTFVVVDTRTALDQMQNIIDKFDNPPAVAPKPAASTGEKTQNGR